MEKREYIHNLKNVKLVIGNGFDLHCGLKTSYKDYFKSKEPDINFFENEFADFYGHILSLKNTNCALYHVQSKMMMTQNEFAELLGISFASVNKYENGNSHL
ncbi:MAG: helix-turn-helix domain-containing protein [Bacilli bacterium]|nr:helix-turn-helix domain-containing protein [Bacilli bacterium]